MTEYDEVILTAAKLREQMLGQIESDHNLHDHAGLLEDDTDRAVLSFVEDSIDDDLRETEVGSQMLSKFETDAATEAIVQGNGSVMSHIAGVTEQDLDASSLTITSRLLDELENDGALTSILAAGDPNTGKTNTVWLLTELARTLWGDLLVISNARAGAVDIRVTSAHDLAVTLLANRNRPKFIAIDEGSTHFDNRTNSREVATQWSPLAKRFSKLGVEVAAAVAHTGKDVDPELKRLTSLAFYKPEQKTVNFFGEWPADQDRPVDQLFGGSLEELEATSIDYDPDEPAPWNWNLQADVFSEDLDWPQLLDRLRNVGPAE